MVLHHREHHSKLHPDAEVMALPDALAALRATKSVHKTVNNDFAQFVQAQKNAERDQIFAQRLTQQKLDFHSAHISLFAADFTPSGIIDGGQSKSAAIAPAFGGVSENI